MTGVEQLTDAFFVMIQFLQRDSSFCHKFESVESLSLIGCTHITDLSVVHIAQLFPKLEQAVSSFFSKCPVNPVYLHHHHQHKSIHVYVYSRQYTYDTINYIHVHANADE